MKKYLIVAKESEDGLWAQFTMNEPLGPKEVKIYENTRLFVQIIGENEPSTLARFY